MGGGGGGGQVFFWFGSGGQGQGGVGQGGQGQGGLGQGGPGQGHLTLLFHLSLSALCLSPSADPVLSGSVKDIISPAMVLDYCAASM